MRRRLAEAPHALVAAFCIAGSLGAQVRWQESELVTRRNYAAIAHDGARVILFGGNAPLPRDDTWAWTGSRWARLAPALAPSGRFGHALAAVVLHGRVLLFGGHDGSSVQNAPGSGTGRRGACWPRSTSLRRATATAWPMTGCATGSSCSAGSARATSR